MLARNMTTTAYVMWSLLSLALLVAALFLSWAAVDLLQTIERAHGENPFFIEEERLHARTAGLLSLPLWIGGILAGLMPVRAWCSRRT
jgi:hypothetical protein